MASTTENVTSIGDAIAAFNSAYQAYDKNNADSVATLQNAVIGLAAAVLTALKKRKSKTGCEFKCQIYKPIQTLSYWTTDGMPPLNSGPDVSRLFGVSLDGGDPAGTLSDGVIGGGDGAGARRRSAERLYWVSSYWTHNAKSIDSDKR